MLINNVHQVHEIVRLMQVGPVNPNLNGVAAVKYLLGQVKQTHAPSPYLLWQEWFIGMGTYTLQDIKDLDVPAFAALLMHKGQMYGDVPIRSWGALGVAIRIDSKVERYLNLTARPDIDSMGESVRDTLIDLLGYCVLGYQFVTESTEQH